jgi:DNA invertase Pin-like site-specific DNA recombinase
MSAKKTTHAGDVRAYVRVSGRSQDYPLQLDAIERCASARGDTIARWYKEKRNAKTTERAELAAMQQDARRGEIRRLYVFRLDRLARSGIRDMFEVVEGLRDHGCELVTVADAFQVDGPASKLVLAVLAFCAEFEQAAINERISRTRERYAREGKPWGKAPRMTSELIAKAHELRKQKKSIREISIALKVPRSIVGRALAGTTVGYFETSGRLVPPKARAITRPIKLTKSEKDAYAERMKAGADYWKRYRKGLKEPPEGYEGAVPITPPKKGAVAKRKTKGKGTAHPPPSR